MKLLLNQLLPEQTGNSGKVLGTDGDNPSWVAGGSGGSLSDGDYGDVTVSGSGTVLTVDKQMSITSDASGLKLSGDATSPGNSMLYGTNGSGVKGWYAQPSGGGSTGSATVNFGSSGSQAASVTVTDAGVTSSSAFFYSLRTFTGRDADELEVSPVTVFTSAVSVGASFTITAVVTNDNDFADGNFKIDYQRVG